MIARIVGERLSKRGDNGSVENRPGGGTNIANEIVARSEPDGHTILMGGSSPATTRVLYRSLNYDQSAFRTGRARVIAKAAARSSMGA